MSKKQYRASQRLAPLGEEGLAKLREIVASCNASKVNECFVDMWSASAVVKVYDAVNEKNKARLLAMSVGRVCEIAMQVLGNQQR